MFSVVLRVLSPMPTHHGDNNDQRHNKRVQPSDLWDDIRWMESCLRELVLQRLPRVSLYDNHHKHNNQYNEHNSQPRHNEHHDNDCSMLGFGVFHLCRRLVRCMHPVVLRFLSTMPAHDDFHDCQPHRRHRWPKYHNFYNDNGAVLPSTVQYL